jgi:hypothetical protein
MLMQPACSCIRATCFADLRTFSELRGQHAGSAAAMSWSTCTLRGQRDSRLALSPMLPHLAEGLPSWSSGQLVSEHIPSLCQTGGCYGVKRTLADGQSSWELIAGATMVEAAYLARARAPNAAQVVSSFSRPLRVSRRFLNASLAAELFAGGPRGETWCVCIPQRSEVLVVSRDPHC